MGDPQNSSQDPPRHRASRASRRDLLESSGRRAIGNVRLSFLASSFDFGGWASPCPPMRSQTRQHGGYQRRIVQGNGTISHDPHEVGTAEEPPGAWHTQSICRPSQATLKGVEPQGWAAAVTRGCGPRVTFADWLRSDNALQPTPFGTIWLTYSGGRPHGIS